MFGSDYYLDRLVLSAESDGYGFDSRISQNVEEVVQLFFFIVVSFKIESVQLNNRDAVWLNWLTASV